MALNLVWRSRALADLEDIIGYIAERNIDAAEHLLAQIEGYAERLPQNPYIHRPGRVAGTREAIVHPNYILIYKVGHDTIEIVSILHARQQYP